MNNFQLKNERRKEETRIALSREKRGMVLEARARRRFHNGKFGNQPAEYFNEMALGTIAQHNPRG